MPKLIRFRVARLLGHRLPPILAQRLRTILYPRSLARQHSIEVIVSSQTGSLFRGCTADFHAHPFIIHGYFNWRNVAVALAVCDSGDTIIELGGNIGTETIGFADIVGPSGQVYTFEPLSSNSTLLQQQIDINKFHHVTLLPFAVGERCQMMTFVVPPTDSSGTGYVQYEKASLQQPDTIEVQCVSLDSLFDELRPAKAIIMDIEGGELFALRGARRFVQQYRPCIVAEVNPKLLARQGLTVHDMYQELDRLQYRPYRIARFGLQSIQLGQDPVAKGDWVCVPSSQEQLVEKISKTIRRAALSPCLPGVNPLTSRKRRVR